MVTEQAAAHHRKKIGERIMSRRERMDMTPEQLAIALVKSSAAVRQWESGEAAPPVTDFPVIADVLETTPGYLAFGE